MRGLCSSHWVSNIYWYFDVLLALGTFTFAKREHVLVSESLDNRKPRERSDLVSDSCAVEDSRHQHLYLIGGGGFPDYSKVRRYPDQVNFPQLRRGRFDHACAGYYNDEDQFVLLVAGGTERDSHGGQIIRIVLRGICLSGGIFSSGRKSFQLL